MTESPNHLRSMQQELEIAHEQLIVRDQCIADRDQFIAERDQQIADLKYEITALQQALDSVLRTRAWKTAEKFRRIRNIILRRNATSPT